MDLVHFAVRPAKPTLVTYHSDIIRQRLLLALYRPLQSRFLAGVDRVVATSPNYLATSTVLRGLGDKVTVIPIGVNKTDYPTAEPQRLRRWTTEIGEKFFLFCGVFRYYKGLHVLLEAAQGTDYPIVLVGAGPIQAELKALAAKLKLRNIHFLGHVSEEDKVALLTLCHGVLFPSHLRSEAFGVSLLEGAMFGKPMISSEIGTGTTFVNIHGETGLVVSPGDPSSLRDAMRFLWSNPAQAAAMGGRAEERYQKLFTGDQMVAAYARIYHDLAKPKGGGTGK
jgi:O-antigen biosynthesis rhamnosyltransferase